jgi:hypothetical protein
MAIPKLLLFKVAICTISSGLGLQELQNRLDFCPYGSQTDRDFRQDRTLRHATLIGL